MFFIQLGYKCQYWFTIHLSVNIVIWLKYKILQHLFHRDSFTFNQPFFSTHQTSPLVSRERPRSISPTGSSPQRTGSEGSSSSQPFSPNSTTYYSSDSVISSAKNVPSSPVFTTSPLASPKVQRHARSPLPQVGSDSYLHGQYSPKQAPRSPRHNSPSRMNLSPRGLSPSLSPTAISFSQSSRSATYHPSPNLLNPYDNTQMGRRSPRRERSPSPLSMNHPMSSTLPRNFGFREPGRWHYWQPASCCHVYQCKINYIFSMVITPFLYPSQRGCTAAEESQQMERNRSGCVLWEETSPHLWQLVDFLAQLIQSFNICTAQ